MAAGTPFARSTSAYTRLLDPKRKWYNNKRIISLNCWILLLLITSSSNGYDSSMMNGLQSIPQWDTYFHHPKGGMLGLLNAIQNIGSLIAYPFAPYVVDSAGRRPSVLLGASIMCIGSVLQASAWSVGMFIAARFLVGLGLTFASTAAPMLVAEVSYPSYRASFTSAYNSLWYSGATVAAWATFYSIQLNNTWAWRFPSLLQGLPSLIQLVLVGFAPESPRWLVSKGRKREALKVLAYYHADSNEDDPLVKLEFDEIQAAIEFDSRLKRKHVDWGTLVSTPGNKKRLRIILALAFFSQWSGNGLVSFYLKKVFETIGILDPNTQLLLNGILQVWNLCWALLASSLVDRSGRRRLFLTSSTGMLIFFTLQTACSATFSETHSQTAARLDIAFIFLFFAAYDLAFSPLIISYTLEILPYQLRAKGFAAFHFVVSFSVIANQYVNAFAIDMMGWRYYLIYIALLAFEVVFLYHSIIETKNRTLEETATLFDDDDDNGEDDDDESTAMLASPTRSDD